MPFLHLCAELCGGEQLCTQMKERHGGCARVGGRDAVLLKVTFTRTLYFSLHNAARSSQHCSWRSLRPPCGVHVHQRRHVQRLPHAVPPAIARHHKHHALAPRRVGHLHNAPAARSAEAMGGRINAHGRAGELPRCICCRSLRWRDVLGAGGLAECCLREAPGLWRAYCLHCCKPMRATTGALAHPPPCQPDSLIQLLGWPALAVVHRNGVDGVAGGDGVGQQVHSPCVVHACAGLGVLPEPKGAAVPAPPLAGGDGAAQACWVLSSPDADA